MAINYRSDLVAIPLEGVERKMTGCVYRLMNSYTKRSVELFSKMLLDSAELERISMQYE